MAVARQRASARMMPNHMAEPAIGAPYSDCIWKVSQRKAPGAMSAMALMVRPVKPSVGRLDVVPADVEGEDALVACSGMGRLRSFCTQLTRRRSGASDCSGRAGTVTAGARRAEFRCRPRT